MARKLRIQYPGAIYHVMNRGDRQEPTSGDDRDRRRFLETFTEACQKTGWQVHAFCLMSNHFHLVVETPQPNLVAGMKWFLGAYTSRYNRRRKEFRRELLEQVSARAGPRHFGEAVQEASEAQAERLVVEGLKRLGWTEEVLKAKRKGDASKVALARDLRSRTTMPLAWIAERLWMGGRGYLAWLLGRREEVSGASPAGQAVLPL
ncbi:MAG: transposase [Limisphaerales bacterium]